MITNEEIIAAQQLRRDALADRDNVLADQPLDLVVERIVCAFQRIENLVITGEQIAETASMKRLREHSAQEQAARTAARDLLRKALVFANRWRVGPVCTKCEIERRLGYCQCEIAANE